MSGVTKEELSSLVRNAVAEAMQPTPTDLTCPDCHAKFDRVPTYLDHRVGEYMDKKLAEAQPPKPDEFLTECKDGICAIVDERLEAKLSVGKEEVEEEGLYSEKDEPE